MAAVRPQSPAYAAEAGVYEAWRAAALSGVPTRTVYHWANTGLVVPSVSAVKEMLWSYADLMTLRIVSWLRRRKEHDGEIVPATAMSEVRRTLRLLDSLGINVWLGPPLDSSTILVDIAGRLYVQTGDGLVDSVGQRVVDLPREVLRVLAPFPGGEGITAPDLVKPRPELRIVPLKVAGEPHVAGSRITSRSLAALAKRGIAAAEIAEMYEISVASVEQAIDLESSFDRYKVAA